MLFVYNMNAKFHPNLISSDNHRTHIPQYTMRLRKTSDRWLSDWISPKQFFSVDVTHAKYIRKTAPKRQHSCRKIKKESSIQMRKTTLTLITDRRIP